MKVFFGTTTKELLKYKDVYFGIRKELIDLGCILMDDWLPVAMESKLKDPNGERDKKRNYKLIVDSIEKADFSVIEYTVPNFSSSHQIIYSITKRKPVLVLRLKKDNSYKDSYMEWIESEFLTIKDYSMDKLNTILKEFIGKVEIGYGFKRYNLVLEHKHKHYLDWATNNYQISRSELVRGALDDKIETDGKYSQYLTT